MAERNPPTDDRLISETEEHGRRASGHREAQAANLFDLRRIIGGLFVGWGILLVILGITDSDAEIQKAAGVNINLWAGLGMFVLGALFLVWAFSRPLAQELAEVEGGAGSGQGGGGPGRDRERPVG